MLTNIYTPLTRAWQNPPSGIVTVFVIWDASSSLIHTLAGFEDYGAYWRYNYETIEEEEEFKYTRDQLMEDVRSVYKEVRQWIQSLMCQSTDVIERKNVQFGIDCVK